MQAGGYKYSRSIHHLKTIFGLGTRRKPLPSLVISVGLLYTPYPRQDPQVWPRSQHVTQASSPLQLQQFGTGPNFLYDDNNPLPLHRYLMSENYRPNYNSYRDESRDPRVRSATNEQQSNSKSRSSRPPSGAASRSSRPSNEVEINERRPLLREIQDERDRVSSGKGGEFPTQLSNTMTPPLKSTAKTPKITTVSRKLIIDDNISDPFTCNLIVDDGKRCVKSLFRGRQRT